jgi:hypothetical protein
VITEGERMHLRSTENEAVFAIAPRVTPCQIIPVLDAATLEVIGRLGNVSSSGLMIVGRDSFAYRRVHEVRFELGPTDLVVIDVGVELVWSKSGGDSITSGFVMRRITRPMHENLRIWLDRHRHEIPYSACHLSRDADAVCDFAHA